MHLQEGARFTFLSLSLTNKALKLLNRILTVERFLILAKDYKTFPFKVYKNIFPLVSYCHVKIGGFL